MASQDDITQLLVDVGNGRHSAAERLMPLVYDELRALARSFFGRQRSDHTLEPTALVHDAYVRLVHQDKVDWNGRAHFFATAARAMRQILVNHAEAKGAQKRGGGWNRVTLAVADTDTERVVDILALEEALTRLEALDPRQARVVELRYFARMTIEETASVVGVSPRTVELDWRMAKAWLAKELDG